MKGIILAGGSGTRLYPITLVTSKQLLPIYDKPMIYYPLSVLMLAGIKDILIITTPHDIDDFKTLLGNGDNFGISLSYEIQPSPEGLAQAFIIAENFIGDDCVCMILGDNIFYGNGLKKALQKGIANAEASLATIFGYYVKDPQRFGIVNFDHNGNPVSIEEKPRKPKSNYCVTGLYFYPRDVNKLCKTLKKSERGEYEITSLNQIYLEKQKLDVITFGRGITWLDTGTCESLNEASNFVKTIEEHQGLMISCPEEIAYLNGWISKNKLIAAAKCMKNNDYGKHLLNVANDKIKYSSF